MYIHLGNGKYLRRSGIVGIFDMDTATVCVATRRFLSEKEKAGEVSSADGELPKSFLLLSDRREAKGSRRRVRGKKGLDERKKDKTERVEEEILLSKFSSGVMYGRTALSAMTVDTVGGESGQNG